VRRAGGGEAAAHGSGKTEFLFRLGPRHKRYPLKVYDEDGTLIGDDSADLFVDNRLIIALKAANPGPPPDTDATDLHEAWDCRLANAGLLPSVPIGAIRVSSDRHLTNAGPVVLPSSLSPARLGSCATLE